MVWCGREGGEVVWCDSGDCEREGEEVLETRLDIHSLQDHHNLIALVSNRILIPPHTHTVNLPTLDMAGMEACIQHPWWGAGENSLVE